MRASFLVAMRKLRQRAGMKCDGLGKIELETIAPWRQDAFGNAEYDLVLHEPGREQPTQPFGPIPIEPAPAKWRLSKGLREVAAADGAFSCGRR